LEQVLQSIPRHEKLFLGGDFNGYIGEKAYGYVRTHGGFGFGVRNSGGVTLLDFATAFDLTIGNSLFKKREEHLVTFRMVVVGRKSIIVLLGQTIGVCVETVK